jgi:hypothetical protein
MINAVFATVMLRGPAILPFCLVVATQARRLAVRPAPEVLPVAGGAVLIGTAIIGGVKDPSFILRMDIRAAALAVPAVAVALITGRLTVRPSAQIRTMALNAFLRCPAGIRGVPDPPEIRSVGAGCAIPPLALGMTAET